MPCNAALYVAGATLATFFAWCERAGDQLHGGLGRRIENAVAGLQDEELELCDRVFDRVRIASVYGSSKVPERFAKSLWTWLQLGRLA